MFVGALNSNSLTNVIKTNSNICNSNTLTALVGNTYENLNYSFYNKSGNMFTALAISLSNCSTIENFKQELKSLNAFLDYELATPIETKIDINNLNLKTFKDLTYITSENSIKPVLKGQATKDITTVIKNLQSKGAN